MVWFDVPVKEGHVSAHSPGESRQTVVHQVSRFCDGFRMTAHLRRCHEHRGRRPKAAKERNRDEGTCADAAGAELFLPRTATQLRGVGTSIANGEILVLFRL